MARWFQSLLDVRKGERAQTAAMFSYIFLVIAVLIVVKSVRQALFLQKFGAASLPYVYLLIAGVAGTIATVYQRFSRNVAIHRLIVGTMLVVVSNLLIFRALAATKWEPMAYILYVWVAVYGILATVQFWMLANYIYDPRQAKRLFAILGVGATLGGIAGGYITQYGAVFLGTENLLLLSSVLLGGCAILAIYLARTQKETIREAARARRYKDSAASEAMSGFRLIWESRYLKLVMAVIALSIIISTVVDNQFSFVVQEHIADKDAKTAFFGQFFTWLGWAAFLMQFFLTGRIVRRFGIGLAMSILPVALFFGSGIFVLLPRLATGVLVKIADGTFRYTTHKASLELLYLPIPIGVKNKTKTFIDMFTDRFSKGIAALIVLFITSVLGYHYTILSWVMMGLAVVWIGVVLVTRREYVAAFRDSLMRRHIDEDELIISRTDASTVGALVDSLASATGQRAVKTLDMVTGIKSPALVAPLVRLAHFDDPSIATRALDRLSEQESPPPENAIDDLLDHGDVEIVSRVLRVRCMDGAKFSLVRLGPYLAADRSLVRLSAIMSALRWGGNMGSDVVDAETLEHFLAESGGSENPKTMERMLASLLKVLSDGPLAHTYISRFLSSDDFAVRAEAIAAAGRCRSREFIEPLIANLGTRQLRYRVRDALAAYGESALGPLRSHFADPESPRPIRQHISRVLERIESQESVDILVEGLGDGDALVRFAALRALGRLRSRHPELDYSHKHIARRLEIEARKAYRYQGWVLATERGEASALLNKTLAEKTHKTVDRLFRLLAMNHPPAELYAASRALQSPNARIRANAIEYLDNVVKAPQKGLVLGLIEETPTRTRVGRALSQFGDSLPGWPDSLSVQADAEDDWLAACALYTIWATRQESLYHLFLDLDTESLKSRPLVRETVEHLQSMVNAKS